MDEEEVVLSADVFDGWDEPDQAEEETTEAPEDTEAEEETVEETAEEESADEPEEEVTEEEVTEEEPKEEPKEDKFVLKHLDDIREVSRDEVVTLAQKGLDYDRIRSERDALKTEKADWKDRNDFLEQLAEMSGQTVDELMVAVKAKLVYEDEKKKGYDITEEQAKYRVESEMRDRKKAKPAEPEAVTPTAEEIRREKFARFAAKYPDVKEVPKEVWRAFGDGTTAELTDLYEAHKIRSLEAENKALNDKIKNLEKAASAKRSTGSRKSNGTPELGDDIFEGW